MHASLDLFSRSLPTPVGRDLGIVPLSLPTAQPGQDSFGDTLTRVLNEVSDSRDRASDLAARFAAGEDVEVHQVTAATEEAGIALDLLVELRNKVVESYRTMINMQS